MAATTDGFELAERDFELRREGDVLGLAQSGLPRLRVATLSSAEHRELATHARAWAERLLDDAGRLADPGRRPGGGAGRGLARPRVRRRPRERRLTWPTRGA